MAHWVITLKREGAAIVVRGEGGDPHAPDRIGYEIRGSPGPVYQALPDRITLGLWSPVPKEKQGHRQWEV